MPPSACDERVVTRALSWFPLTQAVCQRHGLDPLLVTAMICQESAGDPCAVKVERGFWKRYMNGIVAVIKNTAQKSDDRWLPYPDFVAASYGLLQVMFVVALERGMILPYPTSLCDPQIGIEAGCRQLRHCFEKTSGFAVSRVSTAPPSQVRAALLRYNGGGDPTYPDKILAWYDALCGTRPT